MLVVAGHTFRPGIDLREFLAEDEAVKIGPALVGIVHDLAADFVVTDALGPFIDALEVARLLAVHLGQRHDMLQRLILGMDEAQHFRTLDIETSGTGEVDFETGIDADDADILACRLSAVSRTAGNGKLQLGGRP